MFPLSSKRASCLAVLTCAVLGSAATLKAGSPAWWIGASDSRYSTELGLLDSFADPGITQVGNKYYAYATNNRAGINVQVAESTDFRTWKLISGHDALPKTGAWSNKDPRVWAPDVVKNKNGKYVLHYSAKPSWATDRHCVGVAVSNTPIGPFTPKKDPLACPLKLGGAIDLSGFRDPRTGNLYAVYKIDGNAQGKGGMCNNMKDPKQPTAIMLQRLQDDGMTKIGAPVEIFNRAAQDGPLVEAPSLLYDPSSGRYVLFYSSGCYADPVYDVAYVFSAGHDIKGPYNRVNPASKAAQDGGKPSQRLYKGGIDGLHAPGGAAAIRCADGVVRMLLHGYTNGSGRRSMYSARLQINGDKQRITAWGVNEAIRLGFKNNTLFALDPDEPSKDTTASATKTPSGEVSTTTTLSPSILLRVSASLATNVPAMSSVDAAAATAGVWDTTTPSSVAAADLPAGSDASSLRIEAPSLDDFVSVDGVGGGAGGAGGQRVEVRGVEGDGGESEGEAQEERVAEGRVVARRFVA